MSWDFFEPEYRQRKTVKIPRNRDASGEWGPKAKMLAKFREMKIEENADQIPTIDDELKETLSRNYRMLERGTGKIHKCEKCGRIAISSKKFRHKNSYFDRHYWCIFCKTEKHPDFCRKGFNRKLEIKKSDKLQPAYKNLYEQYYKQLHVRVKIYKLA